MTSKYTEGVIVASLEEGLELMRDFNKSHHNTMAWSVLMETDGVLKFYPRVNQPCYGEARPYGKTHPEMLPVSQREVHKPGDLHNPFPDGTPVAFGWPLFKLGENNEVIEDSKSLFDLCLDPSFSPWRGVLKDYEVQSNSKGVHTGVLIKDVDIDPTLMINLAMFLRNASFSGTAARLATLRKEYPDENPYVLLISATVCSEQFGYAKDGKYDRANKKLSFNTGWGYVLSPAMTVKNFLAGLTDPAVSEGGTFKGRYAYNRPKLHGIFGQDEETLAKKVKANIGTGQEDKYGMIGTEHFPIVLQTIRELAA